ncbi:MAG: VOC family protein [Proteobacteria bacterium]|nr:VOC family protein [Pseudomonadota bacterium]
MSHISFRLIARNAAETLDFYVAGLGAEDVMRWIDPQSGKVGHSEVRIGGQTFYLADEYPSMQKIGVDSPASLGGTSLTVWLQVEDLEAAMDRALKAGGKLLEGIEAMKVDGGRRCRIADPAGHVWTLMGK